MVCTLPSTRSLSKARSDGALRENIAKAAISASAKAMSVSLRRAIREVRQTVAHQANEGIRREMLACFGSNNGHEIPHHERMNACKSGGIVASMFTKGQCSSHGEHWPWRRSGNCWPQ